MTPDTTAAILWPVLTIGGMMIYGVGDTLITRYRRRRRAERRRAERRIRDAGR